MTIPVRKLSRYLLRGWTPPPIPQIHRKNFPVFKYAISETDEHECDIDKLEAQLGFYANLAFVFLYAAELIACITCTLRKLFSSANPLYETGRQGYDLLRDDDEEDLRLNKWFTVDGPVCFPRISTFSYNSKSDMWPQFRLNGMHTAHVYISAMQVCTDENKHNTAVQVQKLLQRIITRAKASPRFHKRLTHLICFLESLVCASPEALIRFLHRAGKYTSTLPYLWLTDISQRCVHCYEHNACAYEATLTLAALFLNEGALPEKFYVEGWWHRPDRAISAALTVLFYFSMDRCGMPVTACSGMVEVGPSSGMEQIFRMLDNDMEFQQGVSKYVNPTQASYKMLMMWDFTRNNCNEFVDQSWSVEKMERGLWTLQYGRKYYSKRTYDLIMTQRNTRDLNLTFLNVRTLLSLSVSGLIRFTGYSACIFIMTADEAAPVVVHGHLPRPTMGDLVAVGLAYQTGKRRFRMDVIPGCRSKHKGVQTGNRILLVRSKRNSAFIADPSQQVG